MPEKREVNGHAAQAFRGVVQTYDPFVTKKELTLNVDVLTWDCPTAGHRAILFAASPRPRDAAVWKALGELETSFACH